MDEMIRRFSAQLDEAMTIGRAAKIDTDRAKPNLVYVVGMGGSGIGADFVAELVRDHCQIPYLVGKSYDVPAYVNEQSLVIISSYSGDTEESLIALERLRTVNPRIVCVSSGGKLLELAKERNYEYVQVASGWSSPRACLGYSIVQQLYILHKSKLISDQFESDIKESIRLLETESDEIHSQAKRIAEQLVNKTAIIYAMDRHEPAAIRLRQQLNENAKVLCWHHTVPEMNHNELVGWKDRRDDIAVIMLRDKNDYSRNQTRVNIMKGIITDLCPTWIDIETKGQSKMARTFYLVHIGDWISWYLSQAREVDAVEIGAINLLKGELAKQKLD